MRTQATRAAVATLVAISVAATAVFGFSARSGDCNCSASSNFEPGTGDPASYGILSYGITYSTTIEGYCSGGAECPGEDVDCRVDVVATVTADESFYGWKICAYNRSRGGVDTVIPGWPYCDNPVDTLTSDVPDYKNACAGTPALAANVYCFSAPVGLPSDSFGCFTITCPDCSSTQGTSGSTGGH